MTSGLRILLIDDNPNDRLLIIRELTLEFPGVHVTHVMDAAELKDALNVGEFQLVITDYQLRWSDGLAVLRDVKQTWPHCPVIIFTGSGTEEVAIEAMKNGLDDYIVKNSKQFLRLRAAARRSLEQAEIRETLRESESRYQHLIESAPDIIFATSPDGVFCELNPAFTRITGLPVEHFLGQSLFSIVYPDDLPVAQNAISLALKGEPLPPFELRVITQSGLTIDIEVLVTSRMSENKIFGVLGIAREISERKRADDELRTSRHRLESLSRQLILTQENERRHLSRELHDEIGQMLTAIKMNLRRTQRAADVSLHPHLDENVAMVDNAIGKVRNLALSLRPSQLDDLGLVAALHWLANQQAELGGFENQLEIEISGVNIPADLQTVCFRITQESLTNAVRHGQPTKVRIKLYATDDKIHLAIHDDGTGFDVGEIRRRALKGSSFGLVSMQERASLVGGHLQIESTPGLGTKIESWFPLTQP